MSESAVQPCPICGGAILTGIAHWGGALCHGHVTQTYTAPAMTPADRATLLHAAELLEEHAEVIRDARSVAAVHRRPYHDDLLATAARLREMADG